MYHSYSKSYGWSRTTLEVYFLTPEKGIKIRKEEDNRCGTTTTLETLTIQEIQKIETMKEKSENSTSGDSSYHEHVERTEIQFQRFDSLCDFVHARRKVTCFYNRENMYDINQGYTGTKELGELCKKLHDRQYLLVLSELHTLLQ